MPRTIKGRGRQPAKDKTSTTNKKVYKKWTDFKVGEAAAEARRRKKKK